MSAITDTLTPYAERYRSMVGDWHSQFKTMPADDLEHLWHEARRLTLTNCGWWEFNAAQQILDLISLAVVIRGDIPEELRRQTSWYRDEGGPYPARKAPDSAGGEDQDQP